MTTTKYFITGGAGFIGSNFIQYLLNRYQDIGVLNFDKLTYAGDLTNLSSVDHDPRYQFVKGDICNKVQLGTAFKQFKPDYVINFAAETHVDRSILHPDIFVRSNVLGVQNLLELSRKNEITKFLQISTDEVYGSLGATGSFSETTPISPRSPYSASKASADLLTGAYFHTFNLPVNITRCSNNYGPYQFPEKLIPLTIFSCLQGEKIPVYGDGLNIRDWIYVEDHCSAVDLVLHKGTVGEIYNVGANNERTNIEIVKLIISIMSDLCIGLDISEDLISYVKDRKGHDYRYSIDSTKIQKDLNWKPAMSFNTGIDKTIRWYLDQTDWLEGT